MSYKEITEHIAAIIAEPATPVGIYNELTEAVLGLIDHHDTNVFDPDVLRVALPLALEREARARAATEAQSAAPKTEAHAATERTEAPAKFQRYADTIADLLESEETPKVIRSGLIEFCSELSNWLAENGECVCSPETMRRHLPSILARAEARGIRVARGGTMFDKGGEDE
jgi:hypothetical protein